MMQQRNPFDQFDAPAGPAGTFTITTPRDPRQIAREDQSDARAVAADVRADRAAARADEAARRASANDAARLDMERLRLEIAQKEAAAKLPGQQDFDAVRAEALGKIRLARTLQTRSRDGWFTTGIGSNVAGWFEGSPAYDVAQDTETLKNAGALTRIMEMAQQNGGKNPLTPLSNSDFQALASSLSNLAPGQSDEQYQRNIQTVIDMYSRAYRGAGGKDLEGDLDPSKRRKQEPAAPVIGAAPAPPSGGLDRSSIVYGDGGNGGGGTATLATGGMKTERNPALAGVNAKVAGMLRAGASDAAIRDYLAKSGASASPGSVDAVLEFRRRHPDYRGSYSVDIENRQVPTTAWNRFAASPVGTGLLAGFDAGLGGFSDEIASGLGGGDLADLNARKQAAFVSNPGSALTGQVVGGLTAMTGLGAASRATGLGSRFANPQLISDMVFGAFSGAGQSNDNRMLGTIVGAGGAAAGNVVGTGAANTVGAVARTRPGMAVTNRVRGMFGNNPLRPAPALGSAETTLLRDINRVGADTVRAPLIEAERLGLPLSLADTHPNLRELGGAVVRRSPMASSVAEGAFLPRARGQYDRFTSAVGRDLGPTTNIPQTSADLMSQARAGASDLYDRAYGNSVPSTPELDAVLGTPFGRQALGRARSIAANERRSPDELGFAQDAAGNVVLNARPNDLIARHLGARSELDAAQAAYRAARQSPDADLGAARDWVVAARGRLREAERALGAAPDPSAAASVPAYTTQTLDYVKRGMDDVLEEQRSPITGKLVLDESGRAQNQVRGQLLNEVDRLNPDFAAARAAYAGPMASRDALDRGVDAYGLNPDELGMQVATQTPEHLGQMQLGYRGALIDHAGRVRDSSNPWEATLGSPAARSRMSILYPDNPAVANLMRAREVEAQMAQTSNAVLGNSRTARNQIADQGFLENPVAQGAVDVGASLLTGGVPVATMMRGAAVRFGKDAFKLGVGKRAAAKADALAPVLFETSPTAALATVRDLQAQDEAWRALIAGTTPRRTLGMFGRGLGSQAALAGANR